MHYPSAQPTLNIGDRIPLRFGPYQAVGTVVEVRSNGAELSLTNLATLVGYDTPEATPEGRLLVSSTKSTWIGRAHFPEYAAKVL